MLLPQDHTLKTSIQATTTHSAVLACEMSSWPLRWRDLSWDRNIPRGTGAEEEPLPLTAQEVIQEQVTPGQLGERGGRDRHR